MSKIYSHIIMFLKYFHLQKRPDILLGWWSCDSLWWWWGWQLHWCRWWQMLDLSCQHQHLASITWPGQRKTFWKCSARQHSLTIVSWTKNLNYYRHHVSLLVGYRFLVGFRVKSLKRHFYFLYALYATNIKLAAI